MGQSPFLAGMITMGFLVISGFFVRFWARTHDILFIGFALAFLLLAVSTAVEGATWVYLLRAGAFGILIAAVLDKNR